MLKIYSLCLSYDFCHTLVYDTGMLCTLKVSEGQIHHRGERLVSCPNDVSLKMRHFTEIQTFSITLHNLSDSEGK